MVVAGIVVGLVGQVCSGKSLVARMLEEFGAERFDADECVRQLYEQPEVREAVARLFGPEVLRPDGSVDRSKVAERVFAEPELLRGLTEQIIFPRTGEAIRQRIERFRAAGHGPRVLVLDAPTLFESGRAELCDRIVVVTAPEPRRLAWSQRRGWPPGELQRRERALLPLEAKLARADFHVRNDGSVNELRRQVAELWQRLLAQRTGSDAR